MTMEKIITLLLRQGFESIYLDESNELIFKHSFIPIVFVYNYMVCQLTIILAEQNEEVIIEHDSRKFYSIINLVLNGSTKTYNA